MIVGDSHLTTVRDDAVRFHLCQSPLTWKTLRVFVAVGVVTAAFLALFALELARSPSFILIPAFSVGCAGLLIARQTGEVVVDGEFGILIVRIRRWAFLESTQSNHKRRLLSIDLIDDSRHGFKLHVVRDDGKVIEVGRNLDPERAEFLANRIVSLLGVPLRR